jgi:hypothetical protein
MQVLIILLIFTILIGAIYLIKIKIDEGTLTEKEKSKKFKDIQIKVSSVMQTKKSTNSYPVIFIVYVIVGLFVIRTPDWDYKVYILYFGLMSILYWVLKDIVIAIMKNFLGDIVKFYGIMLAYVVVFVLAAFFFKMLLG